MTMENEQIHKPASVVAIEECFRQSDTRRLKVWMNGDVNTTTKALLGEGDLVLRDGAWILVFKHSLYTYFIDPNKIIAVTPDYETKKK